MSFRNNKILGDEIMTWVVYFLGAGALYVQSNKREEESSILKYCLYRLYLLKGKASFQDIFFEKIKLLILAVIHRQDRVAT